MTAKTDVSNKKIPLKWRLFAWWKGFDPADIEERMRLQGPTKEQPVVTEEEDKNLWDQARLKITQMIWGEGFCGPGGRQNVIDMSKLLALSPKLSAMVIGAGLGGPARVLAKEFGVWINGYETSEPLATEGMKISVSKGLEKKAPIIHSDLNDNPSFDRVFDRAFSKEVLFVIENKENLFKIICDQLKDDSLFLISDYVVKDSESLSQPNMIDWAKHEPLAPFPLTANGMIDALEKAGFTIRIHEDITENFLDMITEAWTGSEEMLKQIADGDISDKKNLTAFMQEVELWGRRTSVMRSGDLRLYRFLAHKPAEPTK